MESKMGPDSHAANPGGITTKPVLCSNPDIEGAREWLIEQIARRALEIVKEQQNAKTD